MKFLIQHNLINPQSLEKIAIATQNYPREFVGVIPFTNEIASDINLVGDEYIPYGSTLLTKIAAERNYRGLYFDLTKLNYKAFIENNPHMLNDNVLPISCAIDFLQSCEPSKEFFTRPSEDLKQYSGQVLLAKELLEFFVDMMQDGEGTYFVKPDFDVVVSEPKQVDAEWRWFIVGGKIISGSMYRAHDQMRCLNETDSAVVDEAQRLADIWLPHECVVMDTALVDGEVKVIEYNCINASGFYDHDINAVFKAMWDYHDKA